MAKRISAVLGFFLAAWVLWYALDNFAIRNYIVILPVLFAIQILINDFIEDYLIKRLDTRTFNMIIMPGTVLHELAHAAAVKLTGGKIIDISLFNPKGGTLGHVKYTQPKDKFTVFRSVITGFAPFFACGIVLIGLLNFLHSIYPGTSIFAVNIVDVNSIGALMNSIFLILTGFYKQLSILDVSNPFVLLMMYLLFCFGLGATPSTVDIRESFSSMLKNPLSTLFLILAFISVIYVGEYGYEFGEYGALISEYMLIGFRWIVLILLISISLLLVSIPLAYVSVMVSGIGGIWKLVPFAGLVLVYMITNSLLFSVILFLLLVFVLKFPSVFIKSKKPGRMSKRDTG